MNSNNDEFRSLESALQRAIRGDVRFDRLARTIYSTDASIYEITPGGVVLPRDAEDILATIDACRAHETPIVPRGAGTGLAGGAVGSGIQLDCSRFLRRMDDPDVDNRTIRVQPGVVLDDLNAALRPHGLLFAPDVATSNRATIGGMIANNSCGAHSIVYGRTVDHVASVSFALSDGTTADWPGDAQTAYSRSAAIQAEMVRIVAQYGDEVRRRFPKLLRCNGGYLLNRLCANQDRPNPVDVICGSEGTLGVVLEAELRLTPIPEHRGLLLIHFRALGDALAAVPEILPHQPAAVELIDDMIITAAMRDQAVQASCQWLDPRAPAVLAVEMFDERSDALSMRLTDLQKSLGASRIGYDPRMLTDASAQQSVWDMRNRGLGLLMSRPGDRKTYAFIEDTAVEPARLREYIERMDGMLREEGIRETGYYAHASVGVIHVRPTLNLKKPDDVGRMKRVADRVSSLALEFGGAMTGEHGDGLVRSYWLEKMYGARIIEAFGAVKRAFDPDDLFNPGKIVNARPMTDDLRYVANERPVELKTHLDFSRHGGMDGLAQMCSGVGDCRKTSVGVMCPSYMATLDETHTTRARANALRTALADRRLLHGLADSALDEVMDLCLLCKACRKECPTGVDMARLKTEWLSHRNMRLGVPTGARLIADAPKLMRWASRTPRFSNLVAQSGWVRGIIERRTGLDRRVAPPRLATRTFHEWFRRNRLIPRKRGAAGVDSNPAMPRVVYFVDTWTNYVTPEVGVAAVKLLERAGYWVIAPRLSCCGRPFLSKGLLSEAKRAAEVLCDRLIQFAEARIPIVGTEPSCILTLVDEFPQLVRNVEAHTIAQVVWPIESFLLKTADRFPDRFAFANRTARVLFHAHCHQQAFGFAQDALKLLRLPPAITADPIGSGCCGMAGSFGLEKCHYEVARAVGEERLFPAVRHRAGADIAVCGFSCRHQIAHHTNVAARHVIEYVADALDTGRPKQETGVAPTRTEGP